MAEDLDQISKNLEAAMERALSAEGRSSDNAREVSELKKQLEEVGKKLDRVFQSLEAGKDAIGKLQTDMDALKRDDAEQQTTIGAMNRSIAEIDARLSGKTLSGLSEQISYEKAVSALLSLQSRLSGAIEGQLSYEAVRESIANMRLSAKAINWVLGVGGVGVFIFLGKSILGIPEGLPPEVKAIQDTTTQNSERIEKLEVKVDSKDKSATDRRLERLEDYIVPNRQSQPIKQ